MSLKLNRTQLKYIAIITMLIDHIAWAFVDTLSPLGQIMHFIGRFCGPTMAYFLYEGYIHTHDKKKYAIRLFIFALISAIPFSSFEHGMWAIGIPQNVLFTLLLGFLAMMCYDKTQETGKIIYPLIVFVLAMVSQYCDWPFFDVAWPLLLLRFRNNENVQWKVFFVVSIVAVFSFFNFSYPISTLYQFGILVPGFVLKYCYSGEEGKKSAFNKWIFYIFYPLHLLIIAALEIYLC